MNILDEHRHPGLQILFLTALAVLAPACGAKKSGGAILSTVTITSINATPTVVAPGGSVVLSATAADSAGGILSYSWSSSSGSFGAPTGSPVTWTAPLSFGSVQIHLTVMSSTGSSSGGVASVLVSFGPSGALITSVNPNEASIGDEIRVTGSGFGATQGGNSLTVSGVPATILSWSDSLIRAIVPVGASTGTVLVLASGTQSTPGYIVIAWPVTNPENLPICTAIGPKGGIQMASDGLGGSIIVWTHYRASNYDIYAQRVDNAGNVRWTTDGVAICTATFHQTSPQVVSDGMGGAIVVWQDSRTSSNWDIYAQRVNDQGAVQWGADGVPVCALAGDQDSPKVTSDGAGGAIMVWRDHRNGTNFQIYAQRIDGSGTGQWTTNGVPICSATGNKYSPQAVSLGSGETLFVWADARSDVGDIYAQKINASGAVQWTVDGVAVCVAADYQQDPQLVPDGSGGAVFVWQDFRTGSGDVYAHRLDGSGTPQWALNGVPAITTVGIRSAPQLVSDGSGGAILTWREMTSGSDIYAQRLNSSGVMQWSPGGLAICTAVNFQFSPQIVPDLFGGAIMVWTDLRSGTGDVYAQRVTGAGTVQWTIDGEAICTAANDQSYPSIMADGWGGAIIAWGDSRPIAGIYAQAISASGLQ